MLDTLKVQNSTFKRNIILGLSVFCCLFILSDFANSIMWLILTPAMVYFFNKTLFINIDKSVMYRAFPAGLFAVFTIIGIAYDRYGSIYPMFTGIVTLTFSVFKLLGFFVLYFSIINIVFFKTDSFTYKECLYIKNNRILNFVFNQHPFVSCFIILIIAWLPYLIAGYPGRFMGDSMTYINQFFGYGKEHELQGINLIDESVKITQHHSVFHIWFLGICVSIGRALGSDNLGVFIYTAMQYLVFALAISYAFAYIVKTKVPCSFKLLSLLFFALLPIFPLYAVLITKDTLFTAFMLIYALLFIKLLVSPDSILKSKLSMLWFAIVILLCALFRNNGIYSIVLSLPVLIFYFRKNKGHLIKISALLIIPVFLYVMFTSVLMPILKIPKGSPREALSIPFQQTARYVKEHGDEVTQEEKQAIDAVLGYDVLAEKYDPMISDPVKGTYRLDADSKDLKNYLDVWFKMLFKHPGSYIQATLHNTYGYLYCAPVAFETYFLTDNNITFLGADNNANFNFWWPRLSRGAAIVLDGLTKRVSKFPVTSMLFTAGIYAYALIVATFVVLKKNKKLVIGFIPAYTLLLICFASPVNGVWYSRYTLPIIAILPVLFTLMYVKPSDKQVGHKLKGN